MGPVQEACKDPQAIEKAKKLCRRKTMASGEETLANQHLFNVYIHVGLNNQEFKGGVLSSVHLSVLVMISLVAWLSEKAYYFTFTLQLKNLHFKSST